MELLQKISDGSILVYADGHDAANPGVFNNKTDYVGSWVHSGLIATDAKTVKKEVKRIVQTLAGANLDAKFLNLENDDLKLMAGKELLFNLQKATLVPAIMSEDEYESARLYRQVGSAKSRSARWQAMLVALSKPDVLVSLGKLAFLSEEIKKYKDDYVVADNKIFEAFIGAIDHPLSGIASFPRDTDFATTPANSLMGLALWDDAALGGVDAPYKTLVTDTIIDCIVNAEHYITA